MTEVIDQAGNVVDDDSVPFATLEDLCEPLKPRTIIVETGNGPRRVTYMPHLSADKLTALQTKHRGRGRRAQMDTAGFMMDVVKECMISPRIKTMKELRAFRKGVSGSFVVNLLNQVVDTDSFEEMQDDLGEV